MLEKGFLRKHHQFHISKFRFLAALLQGLFVAIASFILFSFLREEPRILDFDFLLSDALIFDAETRYWQNIGFAVVSLAFGNSMFLARLFIRPIAWPYKNYKRLTIITDQAFMGGSLFHVLIKLIYMFGAMALTLLDLASMKQNFYFFFLLAVVLFFDGWKNINKLFGKRGMKYMLGNLLVLVPLVLVLAKVNVFDYKKLDDALLIAKPSVDFPKSQYHNFSYESGYPFTHIRVYRKGDTVKYHLDGKSVKKEAILLEILKIKERFHYYTEHKNPISIYADKSLPISVLKELERELVLAGLYRVVYVTRNNEGPTVENDIKGIRYYIPFTTKDSLEFAKRAMPYPVHVPPTTTKEELRQRYAGVKRVIEIDIHDAFKVDGKEYRKQERLLNFIKEHVNDSTLFNLRYSPNTSYQNFISAQSIYRQALFEVRSQEFKYDIKKPPSRSVAPKSVYEEEMERIKDLYPFRLMENFDLDIIRNP